MPIEFAPLHSRLVFNTPLSNEHAAELVAFLTRHAGVSIVDVGCGWAELLMRVLEANEAVRGVGIDISAADFEHAKSVAETRGIARRLEMICGDVKDRLPESAQGGV